MTVHPGSWAAWPRGVSRHFPPNEALALHAAVSFPEGDRLAEIDRITDRTA